MTFTVISMLTNQVYALKKPNLKFEVDIELHTIFDIQFFNILGANKLEL